MIANISCNTETEKDAHCGPHNWVDVVLPLEGAVDEVLREKKIWGI